MAYVGGLKLDVSCGRKLIDKKTIYRVLYDETRLGALELSLSQTEPLGPGMNEIINSAHSRFEALYRHPEVGISIRRYRSRIAENTNR